MTASEPIVKSEVKERVLRLTINRPDLRNAINEDVIAGISAGLHHAANNPDILAIVLTGEGTRAFCAGADLRPDSGIFDFDFSLSHTSYANLLRQAVACDIPLVARVNGTCMAGGVGLLSMCDIAIAASTAQIGLPEVKIGMFPMQVASLMQNLVTRRKFTELCLTGEPMTADEALAVGLLNYVVPPEELDAKVEWLLSRLLDKSPTAIRRGKNALRAIADMSFEQSISFTEAQLGSLRMTRDAAEGLSAFAEKRKPQWTGR
jgi:methylglutaconyl-CoA hydratase